MTIGLYCEQGLWHVVSDNTDPPSPWMRLACGLRIRAGWIGRYQGVNLVPIENIPPQPICEMCNDEWTLRQLEA